MVKIDGYEHYFVNEDGDIFSTKRGEPKKLKYDITKAKHTSYYRVTLCENGITKRFQVHQLVAQMFIQNPQNKPHINHINHNGLDNKVENLEWTTPKENMKHSSDLGRQDKTRLMGGIKVGKIKSFRQKVRINNLIHQQKKSAKLVKIIKFGKHPSGLFECLSCHNHFRGNIETFTKSGMACRSCSIKRSYKKMKI